ncbi:MAG TPA: ABC transporter ATP-binding protein [Candidatus Sulfomarinibacteraceae bacterium]|nr:ABC transporter ATP-binding protein [Candidatus Sulfomarinibacteraceae bacterium]
MAELVIETQHLSKHYGDFVAVRDLNLAIEAGEVFGLLGPNGSGKTTTILMLLGLTEPTAGRVRVLGYDPVRRPLSVKARVGYLPDQVGFYERLTARENLGYIASLNGLSRAEADERIEAAVGRIGLGGVLDRPVGTFSRGMRQRLGVAEVLLKDPPIIIMDEPTVGLDPEAARLFLRIINDLKQEGITILLSSHLLPQVQAVCDRVGLFHRGEIVLEGRVPELARRVLGGAYHVRLQAEGDPERLERALKALPGVNGVALEDTDRFVLEATRDLRPEAARAVVNAGGELRSLAVEEPNLDDIYNQYFEEVNHVVPA